MPISRFVDQAETIDIIHDYRSGAYSMQALADNNHLSKATIVNIVKGYPYYQPQGQQTSSYRQDLYQRLKAKLADVQNQANQANQSGQYKQHGILVQLWLELVCVLTISLHSISNQAGFQKCDIHTILKRHRLWHEREAWRTFADGQMSEFGYHADAWENLTDVIGDNLKNPWRCIAYKHNAKGKASSIKYDCVVSG
jgi:predicted DNA-binding protein YlxM (UPF0122 family)